MYSFYQNGSLTISFNWNNQNCSCFRSLRQDQVVGHEGEEDRQEEEDNRQERQPQPLLQRVLRLHGRSKLVSNYIHCFEKTRCDMQFTRACF